MPDKGTIQIEGADASKFNDWQRCGFVARDVGFAFQKDELVAHASLLENLLAALNLSGISKREAAQKANSVLRHAGLGEYKNCLPEQLSKHQLRQFSLARAMCKGAKVVLLDEPEVGLTENERENLIQEIKSLSVGSLVVVATRDASFARLLDADVINIKDGIIDYTSAMSIAAHLDAGSAWVSKPRAVVVRLSSKLSFVRVSLRNRSGRSFVLGLSVMLGIVALAFVLAISNGITAYLDTDSRDSLSQQPLQVGTLAFDTTELADTFNGDGSTQLSTSELITKAVRSAKNNDLASFKSYIEGNKEKFSSCTDLIDYEYGITPQVFAADTSAGTVALSTSAVTDLSSSYTASFTSPAGFTTMARLDAKTQNYTSQYDVLQGRWPEKYNELVLVLPSEDAFTLLGIDTALNDFFKEFDLSSTYDELNSLFAFDETAEGEVWEDTGESEAAEGSIQMDPSTKKFLDLIVKMATTTQNTYSLNMKTLGYSDFSTPAAIRFYTSTYEDRITLNKLISSYNDSVSAAGDSSKHIDYYDLVDTVTNISMGIVKVVSLLSLVILLLMGIVTTLNIGAITFFSSRDRWRETSVMRVLGATRGTVFLTLILEAAVGLGMATLLSMPINSSTTASIGFNLMVLEPWHVACLLVLGVVTMVLGYLIPTIVISRKNDVLVLRAQ